MADSHSLFATKIETDVEQPLRDFTKANREMQAMSTIQGNLASLAKDIDNAQKKNERLAMKGGKAKTESVAQASNELNQAISQWENQAPYVFEQLQALDETRLNGLRDALTQYQTHELDRVDKDRPLAEQVLNVLLNVETKDEIQTFALRTAQGERPQPQTRPSTMSTPRSRQSMIMPMNTPSLAAQPSTSHLADDAQSQRSGSLPSEPEKESGLKGLKRGLGTVLGRRRESKIILPSRNSESPERQKNASAFNSFSSRFGRGRDLPTPLEDEETSRPRSPLRTMTSSSTVPTSPAPVERQPEHIDGSAQSLIAAGLMPNGNQTNHQGHAADVAQLQEPLQPSVPVSSQPVVEAPRDNEGFSLPPQHLDPISQAEAEAAENAQPGFNVNIRQTPIAEEGSDAALASMANTLKMQAPPPNSRRAGTVRGRRDMRASVYVPSPAATPEPVIEESVASSPNLAPAISMTREITPTPTVSPPPTANSAFAAPSNIQTQTQPQLSLHTTQSPGALPSVPGSPASPTFSSPISRGGTDNTFSPFHGSAAAVAANVFNRPLSSMGTGGAFDHNDTQSIRSGRSLSSSTSQGISKHPTDLAAPGLNASVIETVSAWFEQGVCTRSVVIGEVGLVHNGNQTTHETIRLDGFDKLEKVAPNPGFISDAPTGSKGEYTVDVKQLSRLGVAFKYQLASTGQTPGELAPVLLTTAWKIEKGTAMCVLSYSLNPTFLLPAGTSSLDVKNLTLVLHVGSEGAKAQSCMSKPVGTFDRNRGVIYWSLGDMSLSSTPSKLLAKFGTGEGEAKQGHVEAKWEVLGHEGSGLRVSVKEEAVKEEDPFADEGEGSSTENENTGVGAWKEVGGARKISGGTYHAQ